MAQPHDDHTGAAPTSILDRRLHRYLPPDLADEAAADFGDPDMPPRRVIEAFVHLAAARYTIATYLPRLLVQQLLQDRLESPWLRWVEGSLLFADISGSTALAERLGALGREGIELVTAFLNDIFETMIRIVRDYGGDLVAFGGDALLVYFGDERHPRTAARAALALQKALHGYVRSVPGVGEFPMHLHVGVESGRMAFVSAGHAHAQHYSVLGDTVNGVAAAEGRAGPGEVVVGPRAKAALAGYADGQEVAPGFLRIDTIRPPARPHEPLPEEMVVTDAPEVAIPRLLDDLDRISPYIPPLLLGRILADPERPQLEADLRPVTVLFAQVAGLETAAEALPPTQAAQAVQTYVVAMREAIEQFGGVVNKLDVADEGIKLVAIFGAPAAYEDHAERAARAALQMSARLDGVKETIANFLATTDHRPPTAEDRRARIEDRVSPDAANPASIFDPGSSNQSSVVGRQSSVVDLRQRIGLNLGAVFAGNVGSAVRKEYTVMGDAVNVAARVMSTAAWGEIWCSQAAAHAFAARMSCEERGEIPLKGKSAPLALLRLLGERDPAGVAELADVGPLIGRADELAWLSEQLGLALGGAGRAVRIVGDAGVGKTRLAAELLDQAIGQGARVISATCFSFAAGIPYAAWAEWLKSLCGMATGDSDAIRERKLAERLAELGPGIDEWLPILGDLARLDVPENRLTRGLDPQMRQTRRFELLEQLLLCAAEAGPVVAVFEDLHSADPVSLDLWRRVAGALDGRPALLLGIHRPTPTLEGEQDGARVLALKELSAEESSNLIAALTDGLALPETLMRKLVERAAGNPLFLAEQLRFIQAKLQNTDFRSLLSGHDQSAIHQLQSAIAELPDSLSGLLLERIDRLDEASRGRLRVAAVIGPTFDYLPLHYACNQQAAIDEPALKNQLRALAAQDLIWLETPEPNLGYRFKQVLTQEAAYQSMLYARRRELHGLIGECLERFHASDLDDYYGLLAHHYGMSDRRDKAIEYLLKAGHAASREFANEEALRCYSQALDRLAGDERDPRAWEARDALAEVYATVGRYDDALAEHAAILSASGIPPDITRRAHRKRGSVLEKQGQYAAALDELVQAMAIVHSGAPNLSPLAVPLICADIALVRQRRGEYDLAIGACEEGLRAVRPDPRSRDDEMIEARLHSTLGAIYGMRGDYPRAQANFERSLRAREAVDDLPGMIVSHNNLGYLWQLQSEYERAIEHYRVAEELARKINLRYALVFAALNTAYALISLGIYDEAAARCTDALAHALEMNDQQNIAQSYNTHGIVFYHQGAYDRAHADYDQALQIYRSLGSAYQEANTLMHIALAFNAQGRFEEGRAAAQQTLERSEALHAQRLKVEALNALAEAALGLDQAAAAAAYAQEATTLSDEIGSKYDGGIARRLRGQAAAIRGAPFADEFEASIALFETIKHRFDLARTWAAYGIALLKNGNEIAARAYLKQALDTFVTIGANGERQRLAPFVERSV